MGNKKPYTSEISVRKMNKDVILRYSIIIFIILREKLKSICSHKDID